MATQKFFLFHREPVGAYSVTESNTGDELSVIAIPADRLGNVTARQGRVVFTFTDAGIYQTYGGSSNEGLPNVRIEVKCEAGSEVDLIEQILIFTSKDTGKSIMKFDAVNNVSSFPLARVESKDDIKSKVPKQAVILATGAVSSDPAASDVTSTTTTTLDKVSFITASLMPVVDYNSVQLATYAAASEVGQTNHWHNAGTGGSTYDMDSNTGTPTIIDPSKLSGLREKAANIAASENLILANTLTVQDDYTLYFVTGATEYFSFGSKMFDDGGAYMNIGFAKDSGYENTSSEFWVQHNLVGSSLPLKMQLNNTDYDTDSYTYPDPFLEEDSDVWRASEQKPQTCYVFVLRRDKETNLYLYNHLGQVVGYAPANKTGTVGRTDGDLSIANVGTGFRGYLARWGCIENDIGSDEAARLAKDLHDRYSWKY